MSHAEECSCFDCIAAKSEQLTRDLVSRIAAPREVGRCDNCRRAILSSDHAWSSVTTGRQIVRGRIGFPSDEITGVTRGVRVYRCGECLRTEGELR